MTDYTDLVKRLEEAEGPDRELDAAVAVALSENDRDHESQKPEERNLGKFYTPGFPEEMYGQATADFYTASLDATLALVEEKLPGHFVRIEHGPNHGAAAIYRNGFADCVAEGAGRSPAIALLIALLRILEKSDDA